MSSILDRVDVGTGCISPERRLFVGVIAAAVMDATGGVRGGDREDRAAQSRAVARAWFAEGGDDFQTVCTLAGYDPAAVRCQVLAYFDRVNADPAQLLRMPSKGSSPRCSGGKGAATSMSDVAYHAGVSVITVSRVLDRHDAVAQLTRARVLASIEAVGYMPTRRRATSVH